MQSRSPSPSPCPKQVDMRREREKGGKLNEELYIIERKFYITLDKKNSNPQILNGENRASDSSKTIKTLTSTLHKKSKILLTLINRRVNYIRAKLGAEGTPTENHPAKDF